MHGADRTLAEHGYELTRPEADYLRDDIYELRTRFQRVNYRILYFFHGREAVILSHGITKEAQLPAAEIDLAVERRESYRADPTAHTFETEDHEDQETDH